jgi:hypothetical protein
VKRFALFLFSIICSLPGPLHAAEFWETKPFPEWSDKELQRMMINSPWSKQISVPMDSPEAARRRAQARNEPLASGLPDPSNTPDPTAPDGARGGRGGALSGGNMDNPTAAPNIPLIPISIRWISALPIKQAQMRAKYGKEAATSPEAQKFLGQKPTLYILAIAGIPGLLVSAGGGDRTREEMSKSTSLTVKGKEPFRPAAVQFVPNGGNVDVIVGFERTSEITLDDQEVEFSSLIGSVTVKYKFKLKDMAIKGKLEL